MRKLICSVVILMGMLMPVSWAAVVEVFKSLVGEEKLIAKPAEMGARISGA